jgi:SAM-dependent methyltransferase
MQQAQQLDPLSLVIGSEVGQTYYLQRRFDDAAFVPAKKGPGARRVFLDRARLILARVEDSVLAAQRAHGGESGSLNLGFVGSATYDVLPSVLRAFRQAAVVSGGPASPGSDTLPPTPNTLHPVPGADIRLQDWNDHNPSERYDAIFSFGAFEHFAKDGTTGPQRITAYRRFFRSCMDWLAPGGRLALETIAHDGAPDTNAPLGRGPLGDNVLELFPESLCPHLGEIVLGFEPFFEVEVLRADPDDFARTFRAWLTALREHEDAAAAIVGDQVFRQFRRYLAASEIQFRTRTITNFRFVLHRRPEVRF